jgi:hypothetical protein
MTCLPEWSLRDPDPARGLVALSDDNLCSDAAPPAVTLSRAQRGAAGMCACRSATATGARPRRRASTRSLCRFASALAAQHDDGMHMRDGPHVIARTTPEHSGAMNTSACIRPIRVIRVPAAAPQVRNACPLCLYPINPLCPLCPLCALCGESSSLPSPKNSVAICVICGESSSLPSALTFACARSAMNPPSFLLLFPFESPISYICRMRKSTLQLEFPSSTASSPPVPSSSPAAPASSAAISSAPCSDVRTRRPCASSMR